MIFHYLVNGAAIFIFVILTAYGGYGLWDTIQILGQPDALSRELSAYRPGDEALGFDELRRINPDVCAWLTIEGTGIDYPVVQGLDNFEYLNKNVLGENATAGSIFLDCENSREFTDFYSILMGHHMQGGKMFGDVELFTEEAFFREHITGSLSTGERVLTLETAAVVEADAYDQILYRVDVDTEDEKQELVDYIERMALLTRGETLSAKEQFITLSTCSSAYTNARYLLILRVTGEEGKSSTGRK